MKLSLTNHKATRRPGFTRIELLAVIAVLALLAVLFLPALTHPNRRGSSRIGCVNNLKQIALGFKIFANDHNDRYPMQVAPRLSASSAPDRGAAAIFRAMSNELSTPKVLWCPADKRSPATNFAVLQPLNSSYFAGLDAREDYPQTILAGDRNLTTNGIPVGTGLLPVTANTLLGWSGTMHKHLGNVALGDGSVQTLTEAALQERVRGLGTGTNWLAIP